MKLISEYRNRRERASVKVREEIRFKGVVERRFSCIYSNYLKITLTHT